MNLRYTLLLACSTLLIASDSIASTVSLPYQQNFENGAPGWTATDNGNGTSWQMGYPAYGLTWGAYSGSNCWDINLNSGYTNNAECYLYTPEFDFTNISYAKVSFWTQFHVEYLWDYLSVQYSADGGVTWIYLPFPNLLSPDGMSAKWQYSFLDVSDLAGNAMVQFRFVFTSDFSNTFDGYFVDNFTIETGPVGIADINSPKQHTIYPNPGNGEFFIFGDGAGAQDFHVEVFDANGQPVSYEFTRDNTTGATKLSISRPSNGSYFIRMGNDAYIEQKKVVVMQ